MPRPAAKAASAAPKEEIAPIPMEGLDARVAVKMLADQVAKLSDAELEEWEEEMVRVFTARQAGRNDNAPLARTVPIQGKNTKASLQLKAVSASIPPHFMSLFAQYRIPTILKPSQKVIGKAYIKPDPKNAVTMQRLTQAIGDYNRGKDEADQIPRDLLTDSPIEIVPADGALEKALAAPTPSNLLISLLASVYLIKPEARDETITALTGVNVALIKNRIKEPLSRNSNAGASSGDQKLFSIVHDADSVESVEVRSEDTPAVKAAPGKRRRKTA